VLHRRICFAGNARKQQILRYAQDDTLGEQFFSSLLKQILLLRYDHPSEPSLAGDLDAPPQDDTSMDRRHQRRERHSDTTTQWKRAAGATLLYLSSAAG
jgi:hypothetical protein